MQTAEHHREQFELAYATAWAKDREGGETPEQLAAEIKAWREGDTYGKDLPRLRFGWEGYQWARDSKCPAQNTAAWQTLRDYAEGRINHANAGSCPDGIEGPAVRDSDCPVCQALDAVQGCLAQIEEPAGAAPAAVAGPATAGWRLVPAVPTRGWAAAVADDGYFDVDCAQLIASILSHAPKAPALEAPAGPETTPWCPDVCPITGRPFFMWLDHWQTGRPVPTYGGPYDSYTLPVKGSDGVFECERYDHDAGEWMTEGMGWCDLSAKLVDDQAFVVAPDHPRYNEIEAFAAAAPQAQEAPAAEAIAQAITNNFREAGWSMPSIDSARVLEAVKSALGTEAAPQAPAAPYLRRENVNLHEALAWWRRDAKIRGDAVRLLMENLSDEDRLGDGRINTTRVRELLEPITRDTDEQSRDLDDSPAEAAPAAPAVDASDDKALLDFLAAEYLDLRCFDMPTGQGDADVGWRVLQHHMGEPTERVVSEVYKDDPRSAIRAAIARLERDPYCTGPLHEADAAIAAQAAAKGAADHD